MPHAPKLRTLRLAIASAAAAGPPVGGILWPDLGKAYRIAMRVFMEKYVATVLNGKWATVWIWMDWVNIFNHISAIDKNMT